MEASDLDPNECVDDSAYHQKNAGDTKCWGDRRGNG